MHSIPNLLISDDTDAKGSRIIAEARRTVVVCPSQLASIEGRKFKQIFINIDFGETQLVRAVREHLSRQTNADITAVVSGGKALHHQMVQAHALHAKAVLKRPVSLADVLEKLLVHDREAGLEPPPGSVTAAASALSNTFSAVLENTPLNLREVILASQGVLDELGKLGPEKWLAAVKTHHEGTFQHCLLVTGAAAALAHQMGLSAAERLELVGCALLHDIGKAQIPKSILDKQGPLNDDEWEVMKTHPTIARTHVQSLAHLPLRAKNAIFQHHELLDGTGYPMGLKAQEIGPLTRMITVCDIYGALIEQRSYKPAKTPQAALAILYDMAGRGKLDYSLVSQLAKSVGVDLPEKLIHAGERGGPKSSAA